MVLNDVPSTRVTLIFVALLGKVEIKVSFEYDKKFMTKNNVFLGKRYCYQGLCTDISKVVN